MPRPLVVHVVGVQLGRGLRRGFADAHFAFHAVERGGIGVVAHHATGIGGPIECARAPVLSDEQIALRLRLTIVLRNFSNICFVWPQESFQNLFPIIYDEPESISLLTIRAELLEERCLQTVHLRLVDGVADVQFRQPSACRID